MLGSILASGLAVGAVYALIGVTYNTMFSTSRVMSFTAGQLGMLGGVFGSLFILRLGVPAIAGFVLVAILLMTKYGRGLIGNIAVLLGIVLGTLVSMAAGKVSFDGVAQADLMAIITPLHFGMPTFSASSSEMVRLRACSASIISSAAWVASTGVPNTAMMASPMVLTTAPPRSRTTRVSA